MVATSKAYAPDRGNAVWLDFDPQEGREQAGHWPALVLSPRRYNEKVGLAMFCPITSCVKGYPFEVPLEGTSSVNGVVLADQVKSLDWRKRRAEFIEAVPPAVVNEVIARVQALLR